MRQNEKNRHKNRPCKRAFTDRVLQIRPNFNGLVLGLCPTFPQTFMKIGAILLRNPTNKQRQKHNLLAEVINVYYTSL